MHALVLVAKAKARIWRLTSLIMMVRNLHISGLYPTNRKPYDEAGQGFRGSLTEKNPLASLDCVIHTYSIGFPRTISRASSAELYLQRYDSV